MDSFVVAGILGALATLLSTIWGYKLRDLPAAPDAEKELEDRLVDGWINGGDNAVRVDRVDVREKQGAGAWLRRHFLLRPVGEARFRMRIRGPGVWAGNPWPGGQFEAHKEEFGVEASYETRESGPPVELTVTVESLDRGLLNRFIREMSSLPPRDR